MDQFKRIVYTYEGECYIEASPKLWVGRRRTFWHIDSPKHPGLKRAILFGAEADIYRHFKAIGIADCTAEDWYDNGLVINSVIKLGGSND